jgi:membrane associated rhomboid family serine protease
VSVTGQRKYLSSEFLLGGWSPQLGHAWCTLALAAMTVAACLVQSLVGWERVLAAIGFVPSFVWSPSTWLSIQPGQSAPVFLTWFTYVFPHMGWGHMTGNVLLLLAFGGVVENLIGTRRFAVACVLSVVAGVFALAAVHPNGSTPIGGGSLLGCAVIGIWFAIYCRGKWQRHRRVTLAIEVAAVAAVALWFVLRNVPQAPSLFLAVMWHVIPLMYGWLGYRVTVRLGNQEKP